MDTNYIVSHCKQTKPAIIYLGVGCANAPLQQYPPFLKDFKTPQICILIDPRLEEELVHERPEGVTFFHLRRFFDWENESDFIATLCEAQMIAQDYTGEDIRKYYPLQRFGPPLLKKVLFDVTYSDGACHLDLSAVQIFYNDSGFVNPIHEPLASMRPYIPKELIQRLAKERNNAIYNVFALYNIQRGCEEIQAWCTPENIRRRAGWLFPVFGLTPFALEELLIAHLIDLATIVSETKMARPYALRLLESKEYIEMTRTLASLI
jgi:hypothetical protein